MKIYRMAALLLCLLSGTLFAQDDLYVGYVSWSGSLNNKLTVIDTTGGNFSPTGADQLTLTGDLFSVKGTHGLAVHPTSGTMYILYQTGPGESTTRRLGTVDTETGDVTDIGLLGNLRDITFVGDTLFGATGSQHDDYQLVRINIETAEITEVLAFDQQNGGTTISYNYYTGKLTKLDDFSASPVMEEIDMTTLTSTAIPYTGHPGGDLQSSALLDIDHLLVSVREKLYQFEISTHTFTLESTFPSDAHGVTFGGYPEDFVTRTEEKLTEFTLYPVPVMDELTVEFTAMDESFTQIEVVDLSGKIVQTAAVVDQSGKVSLDLSSLESGIYLVNIKGEKQTYSQKITKN